MILFRYVSAALMLACLGSGNAAAFSVDDQSMNTGKNASRFSDPDEQMPSQIPVISMQVPGQAPGFGQSNDSSNAMTSGNNASTAAPFSPSNDYRLNRR